MIDSISREVPLHATVLGVPLQLNLETKKICPCEDCEWSRMLARPGSLVTYTARRYLDKQLANVEYTLQHEHHLTHAINLLLFAEMKSENEGAYE